MTDHDLISQVRDDIEEFMTNQDNRDIFHSECEFQLELAEFLHNKYTHIYLEYFVPYQEIIKKEDILTAPNGKQYIDPKENYPWASDLKIDMVVQQDKKYVLIELKYKTKKIKETLTRFGEALPSNYGILKDQAAINDNSYHFWKDVRRIEKVSERFSNIIGGFAVFLTNNSAYLSQKNGDSEYEDFKLKTTSSKEKYWKKGSRNDERSLSDINYKNSNHSMDGYVLNNSYKIKWEPYGTEPQDVSKNKDTQFQYCIVEVRK